MKYRPEIDGLRSVAVLPVVAFHAGVTAIPGGFAGVDVFFVISGFLITSIIAEEAETGRFSIARFYDRRARRILPALFFVMLVTLPFAWQVMVPYQLEDMAQSILATLLFLSNVLFWFEADYFAVEGASKPFLHTWSLAVEEQFYVVFPLLLAVLYRVGRRSVVPVLAVGLLVSFVAALIYSRSSPTAAFFLIQFRAWELLVGALAALWLRNAPPAANPWLAAAGLIAILTGFFTITEETVWPGVMTLLPVLGTGALLVFARPDAGVGRVLSWEPVRRVGLISYSLYLWHVPPLALLEVYYFGDVPHWAAALAVAVAFGMAWLSWTYVERPFRVPGKVSLRPFAALMLVAAVPLGLFGVMGHRSDGFQDHLIAQIPAEYAGQVIDPVAEVAARRPLWRDTLRDAALPFAPEETRKRILILGDSLSGDLVVATAGFADRFPGSVFRRMRLDDRCMGTLVQHVQAGGAAAQDTDRCAQELGRVLDSGLLDSADEIVLAANWQPDTIDTGLTLARALLETEMPVSILGVAAFNDMASLSMRLHEVTEPVDQFFMRNIREKFLPLNAEFAAQAETTPGLRYLDKLRLYCDETAKSCDMLDAGGKPVIFDSAHVTLSGVDIMSARIARDGWFE